MTSNIIESEKKERRAKMIHNYELRVFNDDGSTKTVLKLAAEPKYAKEEELDKRD